MWWFAAFYFVKDQIDIYEVSNCAKKIDLQESDLKLVEI